MKVIDLYNFAVTNNLLEASVDTAVELYHLRNRKTVVNINNDAVSIFGNKIEYSIEDVLALFSN